MSDMWAGFLASRGGWGGRGVRAALSVVLLAVLAVVPALALPPVPAVAQGAAAQGSWTASAQPALAVTDLARLSDGRVLASEQTAGGLPPCVPACLELYEPAQDRWVPVLSPARPEQAGVGADIAALGDGSAYVRYDSSSTSPEIPAFRFDPQGAAGSQFTPIRSKFPRSTGDTRTLLDHPGCRATPRPAGFRYPCGQILMVGGGNISRVQSPETADLPWTAELYDPAGPRNAAGEQQTTQTGSLSKEPRDARGDPRNGHVGGEGTLLADGRVLVTSGTTTRFTRPRADMYDPFTGVWTVLPDPPNAGGSGAGWSVRLPDDRVLIVSDEQPNPVVFDPAAPLDRAWATAPPCPGPGGPQTCRSGALLPDGTVLTVGASSTDFVTETPVAALLTPTAGPPASWVWTPQPNPAVRVGRYSDGDGLVLLEGGPGQCGARCGSVLLAGFNQALVGAAQLFEVARITGLLPASGLACGGQQVTITGSGFQGASVVNFGDSAVRRADAATNPGGFTVNEAGTQIVVPAPRHAPGPVRVTVSGSTAVNTSAAFTYLAPGPATVSSLSSRTGPAAGRTPVRIAGQFPAQCVKEVTFGPGKDRRVELESPASDTLLSVLSPPGVAGETVQVTVKFDPGPPTPIDSRLSSVPSAPGAADFTYLALPVVAGVEPAFGSALGGGLVRIVGSGFGGPGSPPPGVRFGRCPDNPDPCRATVLTVESDSAMTVRVPQLPPGNNPGPGVPVVVDTGPRGVSAEALRFAYHPGVSGVDPPVGKVDQDTAVTVTGRGFGEVREVLLGEQSFAATPVPGTDGSQRLTFTVPARQVPESVPVRVRAAGLTSLETVLFTYGGLLPLEREPERKDPLPPRDPNVRVDQPATPTGGTGGAPVQAPTTTTAQAPAAGQAPAPVAVAAPVAVQAPAPGQVPGSAQVPGFAQAPGLGQALAPGQAPGQAPVIAQAPGIAAPAAPAGPAAAAAQGTTGGGQGPGQQGAAGREDDEDPAERPSTRYAMNRASSGAGPVGLGAALMTGCFSLLLLRRRAALRGESAGRPRPRGAY